MNIFAKKQAGSKELKRALDEIDLPALAAEIEKAEAARQGLLIDGTDEAVIEAEQRVTAARLAHDRATARKAELERRIIEAEKREQRAALEAEHARVSGLADDIEKTLKASYVKAANALVAVLTKLRDAEIEVARFNEKLGSAGELGDGIDRIGRIECRVFTWPGPGEAGSYASIMRNTDLKSFKLANGRLDPAMPAWPPEGGVGV